MKSGSPAGWNPCGRNGKSVSEAMNITTPANEATRLTVNTPKEKAPPAQFGRVVAKLGKLTGEVRVRVVPTLPYKPNFANIPEKRTPGDDEGGIMSSDLPSLPNFEHLRKQAKALLDDYRQGKAGAVARLAGGSGRRARAAPKLADAQRVIARDHGFASWARLKKHVEAVAAAAEGS